MDMRNFGMLGMFFIWVCVFWPFNVHGSTDGIQVSIMNSLKKEWGNSVPESWLSSNTDPCDGKWDGVRCNTVNIKSLTLGFANLRGHLPSSIAELKYLEVLDLSYSKGLTGSLPTTLGEMINLKQLILIGCSFTGNIPQELGNLANLTFLALNSNNFTGGIPRSLGKLTKVKWLDLADNQLSGPIPVSTLGQPGLDQLINTEHFHFSSNQLSGPIPATLFHSKMKLIHILFDNNNFNGTIPLSLASVTSLQALRLDMNSFTGTIPQNFSQLVQLLEVYVSNNRLEGLFPNISTMNSLRLLDMSNNTFNQSEFPKWLVGMENLTSITLDNCSEAMSLSQEVFRLSKLETFSMKNSQLRNVTIGNIDKQMLSLIDLQNNLIDAVDADDTVPLQLQGNNYCRQNPSSPFCKSLLTGPQQLYRTNPSCLGRKCKNNFLSNPQTCKCQIPFEGTMVFRAPQFNDLYNEQRFKSLEDSFLNNTNTSVSAVYLQCEGFTSERYLLVEVQLFPPMSLGEYSPDETMDLANNLSSQAYKPPPIFGPFYFIQNDPNEDGGKSNKISPRVISAIAIAAFVLILCCLGLGFYAFKQKKRADVAVEANKPFVAWTSSQHNSSGIPFTKGSRIFSFHELKKITKNFSKDNELGKGGYGMVYKGTIEGGQTVAIKRAKQGSHQGTAEFKTEVELLSRVHHKNLVGLIGFCFEEGEQILVYEYIVNGTLSEAIHEKRCSNLDWEMRVDIALGSARGLAYLHDLANPPIIHRDIKTANILLDENLVAKVADFGLSKLFEEEEGAKSYVSTQVKGTLGYLDPEYYLSQRLTEKSDVYSFGIVLLELLTCRLPIQDGQHIVRTIRTVIEAEGMMGFRDKVMDPSLQEEYLATKSLPGLENFLKLALKCVEEVPEGRPNMRHAVKELESILDILRNSTGNALKTQSSYQSTRLSSLYDKIELEMGNSTGSNFGKSSNSTDMFAYSGEPFLGRTVEPK